MRHKIPCFCDNTFTIDVPQEIDLDTDPQYIEDILAGNFMNFICTSCGKKHKPEFPLTLNWPSKGLILEVLPELDRGEFYRRKEPKNMSPEKETVISYPEMAERIAIIRDDLSVEALEALKYYLFVKADEAYPENEISVWYNAKTGEALEFHIHGIKDNEVAVMKTPLNLYEKTLEDYKKNPRTDPFASLRIKSYCSLQNLLRPEELK
ncbi:MAG: CpXC domain-containing protein [Spirochaetaceae bacterium]|jgi:hypothetical protein|nr:CpXC domain-containing protein [Spirochaetaceae bacterium]